MSKFTQLSDDNASFINNIIRSVGLNEMVNFELLGLKDSKELLQVLKTNPREEYLSKKPVSVCIMVYEEVFDQLTDEIKDVLVRDALNRVNYDYEKDKLSIGCPSISVTLDGMSKWGDKLINAAETAMLTILQTEERKRELKEAEKIAKASKKRKN